MDSDESMAGVTKDRACYFSGTGVKNNLVWGSWATITFPIPWATYTLQIYGGLDIDWSIRVTLVSV
ncbi:uncharacterized protein LOC125509183 [Triticum urartu]|uniref:uncharacterized protein LOC125509183 n=1 Tax=Triticum urartu TaxID=4572 RepID=UPI002042EDCF|nr:uncharacterized protein LOC125509183 [Triticum urartu]